MHHMQNVQKVHPNASQFKYCEASWLWMHRGQSHAFRKPNPKPNYMQSQNYMQYERKGRTGWNNRETVNMRSCFLLSVTMFGFWRRLKKVSNLKTWMKRGSVGALLWEGQRETEGWRWKKARAKRTRQKTKNLFRISFQFTAVIKPSEGKQLTVSEQWGVVCWSGLQL